jgi:hypothetical protein
MFLGEVQDFHQLSAALGAGFDVGCHAPAFDGIQPAVRVRGHLGFGQMVQVSHVSWAPEDLPMRWRSALLNGS